MSAGVLVTCSRDEQQTDLELEAVNAELAATRAGLDFLDGEMSALSLAESDL